MIAIAIFLSSLTMSDALISADRTLFNDQHNDRGMFLTEMYKAVDAELDEFPYMASIQKYQDGLLYHYCGGSIIKQDFVISAAECFPDHNISMYRVQYGSVTLARGSTVGISEIILHPNFEPRKFEHDIALVKLETPIDVTIINLPLNQILKASGICKVAGWGRTSKYSERWSSNLKTAQVDVRPSYLCQIVWPPVTENQRCTYPPVICDRDYGGPLVCSGPYPHLVGVISFGYRRCGSPYNKDVYTDVVQYLPWIRETTGITPDKTFKQINNTDVEILNNT